MNNLCVKVRQRYFALKNLETISLHYRASAWQIEQFVYMKAVTRK